MKQEDTKQKILDKALELFSTQGYDSVSVGEIAKAVGIKAPSLYNHFPSKQAIFDAIVESTAAQYEADTDKIDIHVQSAKQDIPVFTEITADALFEKVRQIFEYSLHNETISRFRRMMTSSSSAHRSWRRSIPGDMWSAFCAIAPVSSGRWSPPARSAQRIRTRWP